MTLTPATAVDRRVQLICQKSRTHGGCLQPVNVVVTSAECPKDGGGVPAPNSADPPQRRLSVPTLELATRPGSGWDPTAKHNLEAVYSCRSTVAGIGNAGLRSQCGDPNGPFCCAVFEVGSCFSMLKENEMRGYQYQIVAGDGHVV
jgi:hypothetical protein